MICRPKWKFPHIRENDPSDDAAEMIDVVPSMLGDGVFIHCEIVRPQSMEGRGVTLWIPNEQADAVFKVLREHNIARRRQ